jgi:hypothetical protein
MNAKITKSDVARYFANELDRARRREIESACRFDEQVREWFRELTPTDEELQRQPVAEVRLDVASNRDLAAITYLSVERDERVEQVQSWSEWVRNLRPGAELVHGWLEWMRNLPSELLQGARGVLVYREPAPQVGLADSVTLSVPPEEVPQIYPDYRNGRLIIRQALDLVPGGEIVVVIVRRRGENEVEKVTSEPIQLERTEPPDRAPYWYADVSLQSLLGDIRPGDDLIYCVQAPPGG